MKKIFLALSFIIMIFFLGCSAESNIDYTSEPSSELPSYIYYQVNYYRISNISEYSLLYYVSDGYEDLVITLNKIEESNNIEIPVNTYTILNTLYEISDKGNVSIKELMLLSNTDLYKLANENSVTLSVDDIVGFNDFKELVKILPSYVHITIEEYLSYYLGREITEVEISRLSLLQGNYYLLKYKEDFSLIENYFQDLLKHLKLKNI